MAGQRTQDKGADVVIGVVGSRDLVERVILHGRRLRTAGGVSWRLVGASYRSETEAPAKAAKLQQDVDVLLLAGPLPYDIVSAAGVVDIPMTYVPMSGASLFSTMIRATMTHDLDLTRISVDSLGRQDVREAYAEIGLQVRRVLVRSYDGPTSAAEFASWHEQLFRDGRTSAAFTTVPSVERRLGQAGVPVFRVRQAAASFRVALNTAALLGSGSRLEDAQIAVGIVVVPHPPRSTTSIDWQHEVRLAVHQVLHREARMTDAMVLPRDERSYLVATTLGSLELATDNFHVAPFVAAVQDQVQVPVDVGLGLGSTALEAEERALLALDHASREDADRCCVVKQDGTVLALPARGRDRVRTVCTTHAKGLAIAARIAASLRKRGHTDEPLVVDAEDTANALGVSVRTARRLLGDLMREGLAWQMPRPAAGRGRPRRYYRLVTQD